MTSTSGARLARNSPSLWTRFQFGSNPALRSSWSMSSASAWRSSRISALSGVVVTGAFASAGRGCRRLVEEHPVEPHLLHGVAELLEVHGLHDIAVDAQAVALDEVTLLARGGHHDHGDHAGRRIRLDASEDLEPVDLGQLEVQEDHLRPIVLLAACVGAAAEDVVQGLRPVPHDVDPVRQVVLAEGVEGQLDVVGIVLDEEDLDDLIGHAPPPESVK